MNKNSNSELRNSVNLVIFFIEKACNCSSNIICPQQIVFMHIVENLLKFKCVSIYFKHLNLYI